MTNDSDTTTRNDDVETAPPAEDFLALLDKCRAQVEAIPGFYTGSPHLYGLQHRIYLRLCGGNIPFASVTEGEAASPSLRDQLAEELSRNAQATVDDDDEDLEESPAEQAFQDEIDAAWTEIAEKHGCSVGDAMLLGLDKDRIHAICEKHGVTYVDDAEA